MSSFSLFQLPIYTHHTKHRETMSFVVDLHISVWPLRCSFAYNDWWRLHGQYSLSSEISLLNMIILSKKKKKRLKHIPSVGILIAHSRFIFKRLYANIQIQFAYGESYDFFFQNPTIELYCS